MPKIKKLNYCGSWKGRETTEINGLRVITDLGGNFLKDKIQFEGLCLRIIKTNFIIYVYNIFKSHNIQY